MWLNFTMKGGRTLTSGGIEPGRERVLVVLVCSRQDGATAHAVADREATPANPSKGLQNTSWSICAGVSRGREALFFLIAE